MRKLMLCAMIGLSGISMTGASYGAVANQGLQLNPEEEVKRFYGQIGEAGVLNKLEVDMIRASRMDRRNGKEVGFPVHMGKEQVVNEMKSRMGLPDSTGVIATRTVEELMRSLGDGDSSFTAGNSSYDDLNNLLGWLRTVEVDVGGIANATANSIGVQRDRLFQIMGRPTSQGHNWITFLLINVGSSLAAEKPGKYTEALETIGGFLRTFEDEGVEDNPCSRLTVVRAVRREISKGKHSANHEFFRGKDFSPLDGLDAQLSEQYISEDL